ncbi:MAG: TMEM175 family protein [Pseudomonadota bacterium]
MKTARVEAFSDGVMAIIITIMVLQFEPPEAATWEALSALFPTFLSYVISFLFVGIFWSNHHNLMHNASQVRGLDLWLNLNFLFWLSLTPFTTAWMDAHVFSHVPVALYGGVLSACTLSYLALKISIKRGHVGQQPNPDATPDITHNRIRISILGQFAGILVSFVAPQIAVGLYLFSTLPWIVPEPPKSRA